MTTETTTKILCATDFSPSSMTATRLAAAMAHRQGASLLLLYGIEAPPLAFPEIPIGASGWERDMMVAAEIELARQSSELRRTGISVETRVLLGSPSRLIIEVAQEIGASLIVVGTHGRKGTAHFFLGSVAEYVVRTSSCPVLVTRQGELDEGRWDGRTALRLAVAADGSLATEAALSWVGKLAGESACDPTLVRVYWPPEEANRYGLAEPWGEQDRHPDLLRLLDRDLRRDAHALIGPMPLALRFRTASRDAAEVLAQEATLLPADALVVGVPKHASSKWTTLGAAGVLRAATLPVFCVPEAAAARRRLPAVRSILIATDLSDTSREAILPAYGLLRPAGGRVELCYVHARGPVDAISDLPQVPALEDEQRAAIEARLAALIPPEVERFGITTRVAVLEGRLVGESILQAAERLDVDLIAIGSHGRSGLARALLGSVAEEVARHSPRPVLIVRPRPQ